jgi:hypothetical protein
MALFLNRLTSDEVQQFYERYIGRYFICVGWGDFNVAQNAINAVATGTRRLRKFR